ncbi:MAG: 3-oxoacyl-[acyl-carrier-protein] synthase 3 [Alphaproteobacteria bacterium]|nr:MAG: 3-oxoacyl-[acyl-carrier-protein] synthase 3 [Alphaproteobacteria bacterium]
MSRKAKIIGIGSYLPSETVSNDDLSKILDTSDEWITTRSGIKQRHRAADGETTSDIALAAAQQALGNAGITANDIDMIIVSTTTPDLTFPATAALVQKKLGISHGAAFDVQAVCSGFVYGLSVASAMVETGQTERALLIGAETMTRLLDWEDRATAVLFGDGGGAVVLEATDVNAESEPHIIGSYLRSDGNLTDLLYVDGGPSTTGTTGKLRMQGREVYRHAVGNIAEAINSLLQRHALTVDDIDWFVPHQANKRIIDGVAKKIGLPPEKTVVTVQNHANTSAASIPLALHELVKSGRVSSGDLIMLEAMGGGLTWGANLIRWA